VSLTPGTRIASFEISAQIGLGGMGEVYRAWDTDLRRAVAIKVLPRSVAGDPDRLARFQREAEILAALNHPNIAQIHGLERADGILALVLEFVDGTTLADRIAEGPIPVDEALSIASQITEALDSAHGKGIVHRDLKPTNIKITPDGVVKVLDFGLAKTVASDDTISDPPQARTVTQALTRVGTLLGTVAYMSPEQVRGQPVDERVDVWAFGCVLYEMLTGRSPFLRETTPDTIVAVLDDEPQWTALPAATPQNIRRFLQRCFEKDPKHRLRDIGDARHEIVTEASRPASETAPSIERATRRWTVAALHVAGTDIVRRQRWWTALLLTVLVGIVLAVMQHLESD
jgi:eukaryotic-like serine/threonine-protein kinase